MSNTLETDQDLSPDIIPVPAEVVLTNGSGKNGKARKATPEDTTALAPPAEAAPEDAARHQSSI